MFRARPTPFLLHLWHATPLYITTQRPPPPLPYSEKPKPNDHSRCCGGLTTIQPFSFNLWGTTK